MGTRRSPFRRALLSSASLGLALLLGAGSAAAQSIAAPPPPQFPSVDANGVDLTTGQFTLSRLDTSVGEVGSGGLERRLLGYTGLRDSVVGTININMADEVVSIGASSVHFTGFQNPHGPETLTFDSGTGVYTFTAADGTVALFDQAHRAPETGTPIVANSGMITKLTRPNGEVLTYTYTTFDPSCGAACSRLQAVSSNLGYMIKYEYAGNTFATNSLHLTKVTAINLAHDYCDPAAAQCTLTRTWSSMSFTGDPWGNGTLIETDTLSRVTTYTYVNGRITKIQRPSGVTTDITYGVGGVTTVSHGAGTWTYAHLVPDITDGQTTVTDPFNHTRVVVIDAQWKRVKSVTNELNQTTTYTIEPSTGRISRVTSPEGDYADYIYNARGNVTSVTRVAKAGSGLSNSVTTVDYPVTCTNPKTCNQPNYIIDKGERTDFTYDANHGGVLTVTRAAGANGVRPQTRYAYQPLYAWYLNSSGVYVQAPTPVYKLASTSTCRTLTTCTNGSDEIRTTYAYGSTGTANNLQVSAVTTASGDGALSATTSYTYNIFGDIRTVDGPLGVDDTIRNRYDTQRQLTGRVEIDPDGQGTGRPAVATRYSYNSDGQVTLIERGSVASQSDVDWLNFTVADQQALTYDQATGRKIKAAVIGGGVTRALTQYSYDAAGRLDCTAIRMNPAAFGAPPTSACTLGTAGSDGPDRITKTSYDVINRVTKVTAGFGTALQRDEKTLTYTTNGQLKTLADGKGNLTTYTYDGFDRLQKTNFPSPTTPGVSSTTDYLQNTYDSSTWNATQKRLRDGQVITYTYDARHNPLTKSSPSSSFVYDNLDRAISATQGGQTVTSAYDALGRATSVTGPLGTVAYQYNLAGARTRLTWPDAFYVTYQRDNVGAVTAILENGATNLASLAYDTLGRRSTLTRGNGVTTTYGYDTISRLSSLTLNLTGTANDLTRTFTFNPASQIASRTNSNTAYGLRDRANGRTNTVNGLNQLATSNSVAISYDGRGNLSSDGSVSFLYDADNRLTNLGGQALAYDPLNRLYQTTSGGVTTRFGYDGPNLIAEYDAAGVVQNRYVPGPGVDEPLVWYVGSGAGTRRWLAADQQSSIVSVTDNTGAAVATNIYDEYGVPGPSNLGRFQYTGQTLIPGSVVYHYKARAYAPVLGRFLQTDPTLYDDGPNLYAYVGNDPVNRRDPTGMDTEVELRYYIIGIAPVQGDFGHQYIHMRDTNTGETVISRAGPSEPYRQGSMGVNATVDAPQSSSRGKGSITILTAMTPALESVDTRQAAAHGGAKVVSGSRVILPESIGAAKSQLQKFNAAVDAAKIPYQPRSVNSNAYAGTGYNVLTGRSAPTRPQLPGSEIDLKPQIPACQPAQDGSKPCGSR